MLAKKERNELRYTYASVSSLDYHRFAVKKANTSHNRHRFNIGEVSVYIQTTQQFKNDILTAFKSH